MVQKSRNLISSRISISKKKKIIYFKFKPTICLLPPCYFASSLQSSVSTAASRPAILLSYSKAAPPPNQISYRRKFRLRRVPPSSRRWRAKAARISKLNKILCFTIIRNQVLLKQLTNQINAFKVWFIIRTGIKRKQ